MTAFPVDEVDAAFRAYWRVGALDERWDAWADCLTEDVVYVEHVYGTMLGRDAVRGWIVPLMDANLHVHAVLDWYTLDGDRVVLRMENRYYNPEPGGAPFDFAGVTILTYAGSGLWRRQEDFWDIGAAKQAHAAFADALARHGPRAILETPERTRARTPPGW